MRKLILAVAVLCAGCGAHPNRASGTSGKVEPKWPAKDSKTAGQVTKDGEIAWVNLGKAPRKEKP